MVVRCELKIPSRNILIAATKYSLRLLSRKSFRNFREPDRGNEISSYTGVCKTTLVHDVKSSILRFGYNFRRHFPPNVWTSTSYIEAEPSIFLSNNVLILV